MNLTCRTPESKLLITVSQIAVKIMHLKKMLKKYSFQFYELQQRNKNNTILVEQKKKQHFKSHLIKYNYV